MKSHSLKSILAEAETTLPPAAGQAAHTPTPWQTVATHPTLSLVNDHITNNRGEWIAVMATNRTGQTVGGVPFAKEEAEANAAFIVRACNSHAALVEALKEADALFGQEATANKRVLAWRKQARAALALAKQ